MTEIHALEVPYMVGDERHDASAGPQCVVDALRPVLERRGRHALDEASRAGDCVSRQRKCIRDDQQAAEIVSGVSERFRIRAAAVTTYVPALDPDERTLRATLHLVESSADAVVRPARSRSAASRPSPEPASGTSA